MKPTLLVLAGGMGSRYGGVKQIDAVGMHNETLLDYAVYDAMHNGFGKVVFVIRKDIETDFRARLFDRIARNCDAEYLFQSIDSLIDPKELPQTINRKKPWGTIHAVLCAENSVKTPFAIINADDYYGRKAYKTMADHLSTLDNYSPNHAMVGYILENTMSESGSVSRGVCNVENGMLVSMNLFGFSLKAFEGFHAFFEEFIKKNIASEKAECLLPEGASTLVTKGLGTIKCYTTDERWFGMTYPEDREIVKKEIAQKIKENYYPEFLWK